MILKKTMSSRWTILFTVNHNRFTKENEMSKRSYELARRLELGALALDAFASSLTEAEWQSRVPKDGRKIGVVVHHVASMYPIEIQVAQTVARGEAVEGLTSEVVDTINAEHAKEHDGVTKEEAL